MAPRPRIDPHVARALVEHARESLEGTIEIDPAMSAGTFNAAAIAARERAWARGQAVAWVRSKDGPLPFRAVAAAAGLSLRQQLDLHLLARAIDRREDARQAVAARRPWRRAPKPSAAQKITVRA